MGEMQRAADRRQEILETARALFREKGFLHTTTGDLIGALGISRGLLYYHFRDLEAVADRLVEDWAEEPARRLAALPFDRERSAGEKLEALLRTVEALPREEDPWLLDRLRRRMAPLVRQALVPILREGAYDGRFRVEDGAAAADFLAAALLYGDSGDGSARRALVRRVLGY